MVQYASVNYVIIGSGLIVACFGLTSYLQDKRFRARWRLPFFLLLLLLLPLSLSLTLPLSLSLSWLSLYWYCYFCYWYCHCYCCCCCCYHYYCYYYFHYHYYHYYYTGAELLSFVPLQQFIYQFVQTSMWLTFFISDIPCFLISFQHHINIVKSVFGNIFYGSCSCKL